jgi:HSP20 family molecular chaperone IbpA
MRLCNGAARPPPHKAEPVAPISAETAQLDNASHADRNIRSSLAAITVSFTLSNKIDQQQISAQLEDGVLTLTLKKAKEALLRRIAIY